MNITDAMIEAERAKGNPLAALCHGQRQEIRRVRGLHEQAEGQVRNQAHTIRSLSAEVARLKSQGCK